jgi:Mycotoxin biosynthesis protein UstYa
LDRLDITTLPIKVNATLWGQVPPSIYRGKPGPEVDAAWQRVAAELPIPITGDEVKKLGKDPTSAVKFPESLGYGPDAYVAQIDVFHQIHCLDILRHEIHSRYYFDRALGNRSAMQKTHLNHCIHVLLQNIICEANVDLVTYNWMEGLDSPFPDFDLTHQCRDFEAILDWHNEHMVESSVFATMAMPDDIIPLRPPPELIYDIFTPDKGYLTSA